MHQPSHALAKSFNGPRRQSPAEEAACARLEKAFPAVADAETKLEALIEADAGLMTTWAASGEGDMPAPNAEGIAEATRSRDVALAASAAAERARLPIATRLQAAKQMLPKIKANVHLAAILAQQDEARDALVTFRDFACEVQDIAAGIQALAAVASDAGREAGSDTQLGRAALQFGEALLAELGRIWEVSVSGRTLTYASIREEARREWLGKVSQLEGNSTHHEGNSNHD
jgi:hypothetical protein